jgi:hypothetical protein
MMVRANLVMLLQRATLIGFALCGICLASGPTPAGNSLDDLLARTSTQAAGFLDEFSDVKCTEHVEQEKIGKDGKVELKEESTYDYLVILTNPGGEVSLNESRLLLNKAKPDKKNRPLLVSNGFATLFLVFHPYYAQSFKFALLPDEMLDGHRFSKVSFEHIPGTRSPAALALRGREYPLELSGTAWIDPQTGAIAKLVAGIANSLEDVGLKSLQSEVRFAPAPFHDLKQPPWLPAMASVEVETPRQHWRNTHRFTDYKRFSVSTEEQVTSK